MNKYLCTTCFEIYDADSIKIDEFLDYQFCPKADCIGHLIEVDELMLPVIIELNKKQYFTKFCCSGHFGELHPNGYITFKEGIDVHIIPKYFVKEKSLLSDGSLCITIKSTLPYRRPTYSDCFKIYKNAEILLKWAIRLPKNLNV